MFKILGDCLRGDGEDAYSTMMAMLPTNPDHDPTWTRQIPIYYSNYYFGYPSENFGYSSLHYRTGTVAWHFWVLLEYMIGFHAGATTGIEIKPCLPAAWKDVKVTRRYGGKTYVLTIHDGQTELVEQ
jgi:cellobiose phosphorylase